MSAAETALPPSSEVAAVADSFGDLMRTFGRARAQFLAEAAENAERTAHLVLRCVANDGPLRAGAIAEMLHADPSTVSRQVAALVKDGLIERRADPADGRASLLAITPKADDVLRAHDELRNAHFQRMLADWSERDLRRFAELLRRFTNDFVNSKHQFVTGAAAIQPAPAEGKK